MLESYFIDNRNLNFIFNSTKERMLFMKIDCLKIGCVCIIRFFRIISIVVIGFAAITGSGSAHSIDMIVN
jgi:hypothetical protein